MLARCSRCSQTFPTEHFGLQRCPHCGTEVFVRDPSQQQQPPGAPPPLPSTPVPEPEDGRTPWERRGELGLWRALGQTLQLALGDPGKLYGRMRYDSAEGSHLYVLLVAALPALVGNLIGQLTSNPLQQIEQTEQLYRQMGMTGAVEMIEKMRPLMEAMSSPLVTVGSLLFTPIVVLATLYLTAGITHLWLMAFGAAKNGWTATFKTCVYAASPGVIALLPICGGIGGIIAATWATGLQIYGLARAQNTSVGISTAAVILFHLTVCCCLCGVPLLVLLSLFGTGWLAGLPLAPQ